MSKRKIVTALKKKNIPFERLEYIRGSPTPSGYADGWELDISDITEDRLFLAGFENCQALENDLGSLAEAIAWVERLPYLEPSANQG